MLFNSLNFICFFPPVVLVYFLIPKKTKYVWLLFASYIFYMGWNPKYALLMALSTVITWAGGLFLEYACEKKSAGKYILFLTIFVNLCILGIFKYFDFIIENLNLIFMKLNLSVIDKPFDIILPVGISFYTFQAVGYTIDVYRGKVKAERNILRYALFVSFFPQLVAGPIERSERLLKQIQEMDIRNIFDYRSMVNGSIKMCWGYYMKMVIADRIAIMVNFVFDSYYMYQSIELIMAAVGFAIQIYCDFASYSLIAVGAAQVMGFTLMENFDTPYFSRSIKEFWRRWHISLSTWLKDYLYIPLGGNRCSRLVKYRNLMLTFLISGLWHGANWTYVLWGGVHGIYQIIGEILHPVKVKLYATCKVKVNSFSFKLGQTLITFFFVDLAWIIFRSNTLADAFYYLERMVSKWNPWVLFDGTLYDLGLNSFEMNVLFVSLSVLFAVDSVKFFAKKQLDEFLSEQCIWFRWGVLMFLIISVMVYGIYGPSFDSQQFIYFQF